MKPLLYALSFVALLAALVTLGLYLLREKPAGPESIDLDLAAREGGVKVARPRQQLPRGGIYAGIVVDRDDRPVRGAGVLLVAFETGEEAFRRQSEADPDEFDPANVAVVGFRTAANGTTDPAGRFRIAADRNSAIRAVFAWREGYSPALVPIDGPSEGIRIVLDPAGQFIGHVVDDATGEPVVGAEVAIYLQSIAIAAPEKIGARTRGARLEKGVSVFARAQRWVAETLGPRVWGSEWRGDETIRTHTDRNGRFTFGPINDEVQLEFVITHPKYAWTEFDRRENDRVQRTVVPPGETVERTFRMVRGKEISGKVLDKKTGRGLPDVLVEIEHVSQYTQHWWYRIKKRRTRTRKDGSFEVGGLSFGPYTATLTHPTFGTEHISQIPEGSKKLLWYVESRGVLVGSVEGLEESPFRPKVVLHVEAVGDAPRKGRHQRIQTTLDRQGRFVERSLDPGTWSVWIQVGNKSSLPETVTIESRKETPVRFVLGEGGHLRLRVWDAAGHAVDPVDVILIKVAAGDDSRGQALGRFVTRGGRLAAEGVAPGRYRAEVRAPGYIPHRTEPFDVAREGTTDLGEVTLHQWATLQIAGVVGTDGRAPREAVRISVKEGEGAFRRLPRLTRAEVPVRPGPLTVRAECDDGTSFEAEYEALDGQTLPVRIELGR